MISFSSSFASSTPATSLNVIFFLLHRKQARAVLAEAHRLVSAGLHLPHHEQEQAQQQSDRRKLHQRPQPETAGGVLDRHVYAVRLQVFVQVRIVRRDRRMKRAFFAVLVLAGRLGPATVTSPILPDAVSFCRSLSVMARSWPAFIFFITNAYPNPRHVSISTQIKTCLTVEFNPLPRFSRPKAPHPGAPANLNSRLSV